MTNTRNGSPWRHIQAACAPCWNRLWSEGSFMYLAVRIRTRSCEKVSKRLSENIGSSTFPTPAFLNIGILTVMIRLQIIGNRFETCLFQCTVARAWRCKTDTFFSWGPVKPNHCESEKPISRFWLELPQRTNHPN